MHLSGRHLKSFACKTAKFYISNLHQHLFILRYPKKQKKKTIRKTINQTEELQQTARKSSNIVAFDVKVFAGKKGKAEKQPRN